MKRKEYSASAVKYSFWFVEFKRVVKLLIEGKTFDDIKEINIKENLFCASTPLRSKQIYNIVSARIKLLDASFYPIF